MCARGLARLRLSNVSGVAARLSHTLGSGHSLPPLVFPMSPRFHKQGPLCAGLWLLATKPAALKCI